MGKRIGMEIALAAAEAVALCRPDVIAALSHYSQSPHCRNICRTSLPRDGSTRVYLRGVRAFRLSACCRRLGNGRRVHRNEFSGPVVHA